MRLKCSGQIRLNGQRGQHFSPCGFQCYTAVHIFSIYVDVTIKERNEKPADTIYLSLSLSHPLSPSFELVLQGCSETQML